MKKIKVIPNSLDLIFNVTFQVINKVENYNNFLKQIIFFFNQANNKTLHKFQVKHSKQISITSSSHIREEIRTIG